MAFIAQSLVKTNPFSLLLTIKNIPQQCGLTQKSRIKGAS